MIHRIHSVLLRSRRYRRILSWLGFSVPVFRVGGRVGQQGV
jgi:hypothetical protein